MDSTVHVTSYSTISFYLRTLEVRNIKDVICISVDILIMKVMFPYEGLLAIPGMCAYGRGKAVGECEGGLCQVRWGRGRHGLLDDATCTHHLLLPGVRELNMQTACQPGG